MKLTLQRIRLRLHRFVLNVYLDELNSRVTGIFGPSGAGKTSLLEVVAGIRHPESAFIAVDGKVLTDTANGIDVPIEHRKIGYVPQDLALFPHLSVRQNVLFGARQSNAEKELAHVNEVLEIGDLMSRGIENLSGGEKQRVSFARALLASPRLLLLDEPLANLDHALKDKMIPYLRRVCEEFEIPVLYVSHDAEEIRQLCDEVILLQEGTVTGRQAPPQRA